MHVSLILLDDSANELASIWNPSLVSVSTLIVTLYEPFETPKNVEYENIAFRLMTNFLDEYNPI